MSSNHFVYNPSTVDIRRSKFLMPSFWKGPIYHGDCVPVEITEVMPGDSAKYNLSTFIRTATPPIFPLMDTIRLSFAAFYVPTRLLWNKEKEFVGENTEGYGIQTEILEPRCQNGYNFVTPSEAGSTAARKLATYLGLVRQSTGALDASDASPIAYNPGRAFLCVWNEWFRNENFMAPYLWNHSETGDAFGRPLCSLGGTNYYYGSLDLPKVCKQLDRFTSSLPWAQKGSPVLLSFYGDAPVIAKDTTVTGNIHDMGYATYLGHTATDTLTKPLGTVSSILTIGNSSFSSDVNSEVKYSNLFADLGSATAKSINEIRLAFATQRYLEALARSGSKYREYIKGMFGVNIGDTTAQMPEYLGGFSMELNIDQVLQTTGFAAGSSTTLGAPGASSTSAASKYLFTKSFTEPGYIVIVAYTKHNRSYSQGIDEIYQKHEILEKYNPKFANIGEQAIKKSLLYFTGKVADDNTRWGFQEAWSEYRTKRDVIIGALAASNSSSYNFTNLGDNYASAPTLNADFLTEDRANITRCLAGGDSSPDYFLDIKFNREFVRPMPLYSIPGLIDHH